MNGVGLGGAPFPLGFSVREVRGSWVVDATAAQAVELVDVLERAANDTVVVVDVATNSFLDEVYVQWRPSRIAAEQGVSCEVQPLGALASGVVGLSEEVLVMRWDDLARFLAGWSPYELTLIDVPGTPTPDRLDEIVLAIGTATHDEPVLPALVGSCLWFSGHDDCYVAVESTDRAMPAAVLGRLLALLVGSALVDDSSVDVSDPDGVIVEALIEESWHWIGALGTVSENFGNRRNVRHVRAVAARSAATGRDRPHRGLRCRARGVAARRPTSTRMNHSNTQDLKGSAAPPPGGCDRAPELSDL